MLTVTYLQINIGEYEQAGYILDDYVMHGLVSIITY